jgi:predicted transposase YdaD
VNRDAIEPQYNRTVQPEMNRAIDELIALPRDHPYQAEILFHISRLQVNLNIRQNKTKDIREVMMNLAPAYDKWLEETLTQGRGEGLKEGREETQTAIAIRLMRRNMPLNEISQDTGLSIETLEALRSVDSSHPQS